MQLRSAGRLGGQLGYGHRYGGLPLPVHGDLEAVRYRVRQRYVEYQDGAGFGVGHARRGLGEGDVAVAAEDFRVLFVEQADLHVMLADLGALPLEPQHEVQPGVHGGKLLHPDVLEDPEDGELARLIDERVVRDDGKVEVHARPLASTLWRRGSTPGFAPTRAAARRPGRPAAVRSRSRIARPAASAARPASRSARSRIARRR